MSVVSYILYVASILFYICVNEVNNLDSIILITTENCNIARKSVSNVNNYFFCIFSFTCAVVRSDLTAVQTKSAQQTLRADLHHITVR